MSNGIPQYAALLKLQYLFRGLDDARIAHVVTKFEPVELDEGTLVINEGDEGDEFFVIFQGKVRVTRKLRHKERDLGLLGPGDYFGEEALLFKRHRSASVMVVEPTVLLRLGRDQFFELLQEFPQIKMNLSATAQSRHLARKEKFDWLGKDEVIYLITRKHVIFLLIGLIAPIFFGVASIPVIAYGFSTYSLALSRAATIGGLLGIVGSILWGIWKWMDWGNDYYIVTNQRVVWLERVIVLYDSRREAPLTAILAVNVTSSQLGRILNYGDVNVRTFTGGFLMRNASGPKQFAEFIQGFQARAENLLKQADTEAMEETLRKRLSRPEAEQPPRPAPPQPPGEAIPNQEKKPSALREILDTFLKVRYERGKVVTYRKHWLLLLRKIWLPSLGFASLVAVTIALAFGNFLSDLDSLSRFYLVVIAGFLYLIAFMWWGYHYLDWNNDIYCLTPTGILDVERKPLGREVKKTASLDSILSLEHTRDGIVELLFNFGNVTINVGETKFIFRGVHNPDLVHQDITDYMEARTRKKQAAERVRERERMVDWLVTYRRQTEILDEIGNESG